jgi:hypothetical protein
MGEITSSNVKTFTMNDVDTACRRAHANSRFPAQQVSLLISLLPEVSKSGLI